MVMVTAATVPVSVGIQHVLIATDLSHQSELVTEVGLHFAQVFGAHAEIAYVLPSEEYALAGPEGVIAGRDAARRDLLALKARLDRSASDIEGVEHDVALLEGAVADCLLQFLQEKKCDLVVVGTHGRGGLGKVFLGSVAENVFRHSPVPVLTVGPNLHRSGFPERPREILAPCDLAPKSHSALRYACDLATAVDAHLTILHVVEGASEGTKVDPDRVRAAIRERLADIVGRRAAGLDVSFQIEFGRVAPTILRVASQNKAEMIVLGVRSSHGMLDRFQWPVAYELVREAPCPILTIRDHSPRVSRTEH